MDCLVVFPRKLGVPPSDLALTVQNADDPVFSKAVNGAAAWSFTGIVTLYPNATVDVDLIAPFANGLTATPSTATIGPGTTAFTVNINYNSAFATGPNPAIGTDYFIRVRLQNGSNLSNEFQFPVTFQP